MTMKIKCWTGWRILVLLLVANLLSLTVLTGCSRKTSTETAATSEASSDQSVATPPVAGVATIDVNKIAADCGALAEINRELDKKESEFNLILDGMRKIHLDELSKLEKKYGDKPTEEQQQEIATLRKKQASEYNVKWQNTRIQLTAIKQKLDEAFLTRVRPIAQKVAKEKGLSVVIRSENVFCLVEHFDITGPVISKFKTNFPAKSEGPVVEVAEIPSRGGGFVPRK